MIKELLLKQHRYFDCLIERDYAYPFKRRDRKLKVVTSESENSLLPTDCLRYSVCRAYPFIYCGYSKNPFNTLSGKRIADNKVLI